VPSAKYRSAGYLSWAMQVHSSVGEGGELVFPLAECFVKLKRHDSCRLWSPVITKRRRLGMRTYQNVYGGTFGRVGRREECNDDN
jgi:hypothetical protein